MMSFALKAWQSALIDETVSLSKAIQHLDESALQILIVCDASGAVKGTLTDGDIRRGLIQGHALNDPITGIFNSSPTLARAGWSNARMLAVMEERQLLQLPVVDDSNTIVDLVTLQGLLSRPKQSNKVVLMAGGLGTRLRPLTEHCPKPMLKIGKEPILELIIKSFIDSGYDQFFITTHYMPQVIQDYFGDGSDFGAKISYVHEAEPLGTAGALSLLPKDQFDEPFFLMNGDILTDIDPVSLMATHERLEAEVTVCLREHETQIPFGVVSVNDEYLSSIEEKPIHRVSVSAGIYLLDNALLGLLPEGEYLDMPDLIAQRSTEGKQKVGTYHINGTWIDIGRIDDFQKAQALISNLNN
jgi:dTDP-glucose pyrophosphorylase